MDNPDIDLMVVNMNVRIRPGGPAKEGLDSANTYEDIFIEYLYDIYDTTTPRRLFFINSNLFSTC